MRATRHRRAQAVVILLLSALVTGCLVFAPMFTRAVAQASLSSHLDDGDTSLRLTSWSASQPSLVRSPRELSGLVPDDIRAHHAPSTLALFVMVTGPAVTRPIPLAWLSTECASLRIVAGRCPVARAEILVPAGGTSGTRSWRVGTQITVAEADDAVTTTTPPTATVEVVGTYEPRSGVPADLGLGTGAHATPVLGLGPRDDWLEPHSLAVYPLRRGTVSVDNIAGLGSTMRQFIARPWAATASTPVEQQAQLPVYASSGLPAVADAVAIDRSQANVTVPVLTVQLAVLFAVVLWLVLVAATEQRRPEVAVAKLRGRGAAGSRRLLLQESLPPVLVGLPVGVLLAILLSATARRLILPGGAPFEVPSGAVVTFVIAAVAVLGLTLASVRRASEEPVAGLLRSVPATHRALAPGILEAMVVAAAATAFVALATRSVTGPVALAAPTLLAVAVGVVGARVVPLLLRPAGTFLLRRGWTTAGTGLLQAGRRSATRWLVPVVTVGLCLVVFAADAVAVGARNRTDRAGVEIGAAAVLSLDPVDARVAARAVDAADPGRRHLTPVALVTPPSAGGPATLGVVPTGFSRVAAWPGVDPSGLAWARLRPAGPGPVRITGTRLRATLESTGAVDPEHPRRPTTSPLTMSLDLVGSDGSDVRVVLAYLTATPGARHLDAALPCDQTCTVRGIAFSSAVGVTLDDRVTLTGLSTEYGRVELGPASRWRPGTDGAGTLSAQGAPGGLTMVTEATGGSQVSLDSMGLPQPVPALATPPLAGPGSGPTGQFIDGSPMAVSVAGVVPFAPGSQAATFVVSLDTLALQRWQGAGDASLLVYSDRADPAYLASVERHLAADGVRVVATSTQAGRAARYAASAAAWSMQLALVVGVMAILAVLLALVVLVQTSADTRSRDYAGLRMAGLSAGRVRRVALGELLPVVVAASVLGAAAGLLAIHAAMPLVPLFATRSPVYVVDLGTAWWAAGAAAVAGLAVLVATAAAAGSRVAAGSDLDRLREDA